MKPSNLLKKIVEFEGNRVYQKDIFMIAVELATKMTYRDTVKEGKFITKDFPSPCTVNQRVIVYGAKIQQFITEKKKTKASISFLLMGRKPIAKEEV